MQMALAALPAVGGGLFSAGSGVAATAGSIFSGIATGVSAISSIQAGKEESRIMRMEAQQKDIQAKQAELQGREQAVNSLNQMNRQLASANVSMAARGLSGSSALQSLATDITEQGSYDVQTALRQGTMQADLLSAQGQQYRAGAKTARRSGYMQAGKSLFQYGARTVGRGRATQGSGSITGVKRDSRAGLPQIARESRY